MGQVGKQDGNVGHLRGHGIAVLGGQGGQVGILRPLGVLHQLGGFQGYAGAQGPQVVELLPVALLAEGQPFIAQFVADHGYRRCVCASLVDQHASVPTIQCR